MCPDMLLKSQQIAVERFSRRQIGYSEGHCSEDRRVSLGRLDLIEFREQISSVFDGVGVEERGAQLSFEPVEVVLFGCSTSLGLSPPLKSIVSKKQSNLKNQS